MQDLSEFIAGERRYFEGNANNLYASSIGVIQGKLQKIEVLRNTAIPLIDEYGKLFSDPEALIPEEIQNQISKNVVLKIEVLFESFFMYGAMLCDDIAHLLIYLFGNPRGVKLGSHRKLCANFYDYANALSLEYDEAFLVIANYLEQELCEYRDKQIVHDFHARKLDTLNYSNSTKDVHLAYGMLHPKPTDTYQESKSWGELCDKIDEYIELLLLVLKDNKGKMRFADKA